jgi:hypothetical protein
MEKKEFVGPKDQQLFASAPMMDLEPQTGTQTSNSDSDAAFNDMLGFDPFTPPEIMKDHSSVGGIESDGTSPQGYRAPSTTISPPMSKPYFNRSIPKNPKSKYSPKVSDSAKAPSEEVPKLAFDLDSGKVFDEKTGKWFRLVAE